MSFALHCPTALRLPIGFYSGAAGTPKHVWNFEAGYHTAGFAVQRASIASGQSVNGTYANLPENTPRYTASKALLLEAGSGNLAVVESAPVDTSGLYTTGAATAALSLVSDAAALNAAGLGGVTGGKAFLLDNSAGSTNARIALQASVNSTLDWVLSAFVRATGIVTLRTGYGGYGAIGTLLGDPTVSATAYTRVSRNRSQKQNGAYNAADAIWFDISAGGKLWLCCPQWESGRLTATSPIFRSGASTTRATETLLLKTGATISAIKLQTATQTINSPYAVVNGGVTLPSIAEPILRISAF